MGSMKIATLILGGASAAFAAASIYLALDLGATRDQLAVEMQARELGDARVAQLEGQLAQARAAQLATLRPPRPPASASSDIQQPRAMPDVERASPMEQRGVESGERLAKLFNSPAGQRSMRLQQEIRLRRVYADMPGELGLDAAQTDKLFDLLADNQVATINNTRGLAGDRTAMQALEAAGEVERDAAISALLGPDKAAEFQSFEKTIDARMQVGRIGESMAAANVPLREDQRKSMIAAVAAEQAAKPRPTWPNDGGGSDGQIQFLDWQADYSQRVQAKVEPMLTSEQVARYREAVAMQNARRADQRARLEARRSSSGL